VHLVDEGSWHPNALRRLRLRWRRETFLRSRVERWFRALKARDEEVLEQCEALARRRGEG